MLDKNLLAKAQKIKLVVSDLDGTLLNAKGELSDFNLRMVQELRAKGINFTFATGRMDKMTWHFAEQLKLDLPIIGCNGAVMRYKGMEKAEYANPLSGEQVIVINDLLNVKKVDHLFYSLDNVYYTEKSSRLSTFENYNRMAETSGQDKVGLICLNDCPNYLPQEEIYKCYMVFSEKTAEDEILQKNLQSIENLEMTVSSKGAADLMFKGSCKGAAVQIMREKLGLSKENVLCLGDQKNDLSMFREAGIAVAMAGAIDELKQEADLIAPDHDADGEGKILQELFQLSM